MQLTPDKWERAKAIFDAALQRPARERESFIAGSMFGEGFASAGRRTLAQPRGRRKFPEPSSSRVSEVTGFRCRIDHRISIQDFASWVEAAWEKCLRLRTLSCSGGKWHEVPDRGTGTGSRRCEIALNEKHERRQDSIIRTSAPCMKSESTKGDRS